MSSALERQYTKGKTYYDAITLSLFRRDRKEFLRRKVIIWNGMLILGLKPKKWLKPTNRHLPVVWERQQNEEDFEKEMTKLKNYVETINKEYGMTLLVRG